jgi:hypothetical protein
MTVAAANVDADYQTVFWFRRFEKRPQSKLSNSIVNIGPISVGEVEESFIAGTGHVEDRLLSIDFHLSGVLIFFVKSTTEGVGSSGC